MLFAAFYKFLDVTGLDWRWLVAYGPRLIMAVFVWLSDEYLYKYTNKRFGSRMANATWVLYLAHWYVFYAMCRTYSNSLEAIFFFIAFYYWSEERYPLCNLFIGFAWFCRPTAVLLALVLYLLRPRALISAIPIGLLCISVQVAADSWWYGNLTITLLNFFHFNVYTGLSGFYGEFAWHWYFTNALPTILTTYLPCFALGMI